MFNCEICKFSSSNKTRYERHCNNAIENIDMEKNTLTDYDDIVKRNKYLEKQLNECNKQLRAYEAKNYTVMKLCNITFETINSLDEK